MNTQSRILWSSLLAALIAACAPLQVLPPSVAVEGRISGKDGAHQPAPDVVTTLTHDGTAAARTGYSRSIAIQDVESARLAMTASTGLPFAEEWHLLHLSRAGQRPGDEPVIVEFSADRGFVRSHTGELAWLTVRKDDLALPTATFSNFPPVALRSGGALILSRVENDDPVLPWTSTACNGLATLPLAATLRPLAAAGAADCFDMQSLASLLLNQIAMAVTDAARAQNARAVSHALAIVPHIATPATGGAPSPRPGVGFVYRTTLEPMLGNVGLAPFTGTLTLSVPITWVFGRAPGSNGVATALDPITVALPGTALGNGPRITVHAVDGSVSALFAEQLRTGVLAAVVAAPIPTGPGNLPINSFLDFLLVETVLDNEPSLPVDFSVLALPADRTVTGAPDNTALRMGEITFTIRAGVAPALPGGIGARTVVIAGDGTVRVLVNLNAGGTRVRNFALPAPAEPLPFNLVVQR